MTSLPTPDQILDLREEPVELYKILKFSGIASSGAHAKIIIDEGEVKVNGKVETRRRRKMLIGDIIEIDELVLGLRLEESE